MMSEQKRRIVVGVDGSEPSKLALRWAIRQAKLTGGSVDAVIAWRYPSTYGWAPGMRPEHPVLQTVTDPGISRLLLP